MIFFVAVIGKFLRKGNIFYDYYFLWEKPLRLRRDLRLNQASFIATATITDVNLFVSSGQCEISKRWSEMKVLKKKCNGKQLIRRRRSERKCGDFIAISSEMTSSPHFDRVRFIHNEKKRRNDRLLSKQIQSWSLIEQIKLIRIF